MTVTAPLATLAADLPIVWTTRELKDWLERLPALERAELAWTRPQFEAALRRLLEEPLEPAGVDAATCDFLRVSLGCRRFLRRLLQSELPLAAIFEPWRVRLPEIAAFLESSASGEQAELTLQALIAVFRAFEEQLRTREQDNAESISRSLEDQDVSALPDEQLMTSPMGDITRAHALFAALLEAFERRFAPARGRELARLALRHAVRGVSQLRFDIGSSVEVEIPAEPREDRLLHAAALLALAGQANLPSELAGTPSTAAILRLMAPSVASTPVASAPLPRLRRVTAKVTAVAWSPPAIALDGQLCWFSATPEMVERALSLRGELTQAVVLDPKCRLLRIDPAAGPDIPNAEGRTEAMLQDWGELLHRLAR